MFILDHDGIPIPNPYEVEQKATMAPNMHSPHYAVVVTQEQIKVASLTPHLVVFHWLKALAHVPDYCCLIVASPVGAVTQLRIFIGYTSYVVHVISLDDPL